MSKNTIVEFGKSGSLTLCTFENDGNLTAKVMMKVRSSNNASKIYLSREDFEAMVELVNDNQDEVHDLFDLGDECVENGTTCEWGELEEQAKPRGRQTKGKQTKGRQTNASASTRSKTKGKAKSEPKAEEPAVDDSQAEMIKKLLAMVSNVK